MQVVNKLTRDVSSSTAARCQLLVEPREGMEAQLTSEEVRMAMDASRNATRFYPTVGLSPIPR